MQARLDDARTDDGRCALIDRLDAYERSHQAAPVERHRIDYLRTNVIVETPAAREERRRLRRRDEEERRKAAVVAKNAHEAREVTRRNLETRDMKEVSAARDAQLARAVARLARYEGSARAKRWLSVALLGARTRALGERMRRARSVKEQMKVMRATHLMIRFVKKTMKTRELDRAVACVLYARPRGRSRHLWLRVVVASSSRRRRAVVAPSSRRRRGAR